MGEPAEAHRSGCSAGPRADPRRSLGRAFKTQRKLVEARVRHDIEVVGEPFQHDHLPVGTELQAVGHNQLDGRELGRFGCVEARDRRISLDRGRARRVVGRTTAVRITHDPEHGSRECHWPCAEPVLKNDHAETGVGIGLHSREVADHGATVSDQASPVELADREAVAVRFACLVSCMDGRHSSERACTQQSPVGRRAGTQEDPYELAHVGSGRGDAAIGGFGLEPRGWSELGAG